MKGNNCRAPRSPLIRALEPRLLFDGAAVGATADVATDQTFAVHGADAVHAGKGSTAEGPVTPAAKSPAARALDASQQARAGNDAEDSRSAVFIDSAAANGNDELVAKARAQANTDVYVVDAAEDGLVSMATALRDSDAYDSVSIVGEASADRLSLGASSLSTENLADHADDLSTIGNAIAEDGELRIVDLSVADGPAGKAFIDELSARVGGDGPDVDVVVTDVDGDHDDPAESDATAPAITDTREMIFVDTTVDNYEDLISQIGSDAQVTLIDGSRDGVEQINDALEGRSDIGAIHIISHGSEGELTLGTATLNADTMRGRYADELGAIGNALSESGDILIYGCDFTGGPAGAEAAAMLAGRTGADVAASSDDTGHASLGGDWDLETHVGEIEAESVAANDWAGRLAPPMNFDFSDTTPTLESGTAGNVGAIYRFQNVATGVDALVEITGRSGAVLAQLDDTTQGINEAFQPEIDGNQANSFVQFTISFVDSGTSDARVVSFTASGLDVDNPAETLQFRGASGYTVESPTDLNISVDAANNINVIGGNQGFFPTNRANTEVIIGVQYTDVTSFTYRAGINGNATRQTALLFEDVAFNDPVTVALPVASNDTVSTPEDTPLTFNPRANDDLGTGPTTISAVQGTSNQGGSVTSNGDGTLTYSAPPNFNGADSFTYTIRDANGRTSTATVTVNVAPVNDVPVANDDSGSTNENATANGNVVFNDTDADGDSLTVGQVNGDAGNVGAAVAGTNGGLFTVNANGSYTFDPSGEFDDLGDGESRISTADYTVSDGNGGTDTATLTITVNGVNDPPTAVADVATTPANIPISRDAANGVLSNDSDPEADPLAVSQVNGNAAGVGATVAGSDGGQFTVNADGSYDFDPSGDFDGLILGQSRTTSVSYQVSDGEGGTATAQLTVAVTIGVTPPNAAPEATNDADSTTENTAISRNVANGVLANDNDAEGDALTVTEVEGNGANVAAAVTGSNGGQFTVNADGSYDFDPGAAFDDLAAGESRATAVGYTVADGNGGTDTATLTVTVNGVNDAPTTSGLNDLSSNDADVVSVPTAGAFADADVNDVLTYSAAGLPAGLTIDAATGEISGTIASDASVNGPYSVTVTASDGTESVDAVFSWAIANPDVVAMDDGDTTDEDTAISRVAAAGVLANDTDPDGDALTVSQVDGATGNVGVAVTGGAGGQFTLNADGSYDFDPNGDFDDLAAGESRVTSVTYQVSDGQGGLDTARLTVTVDGVNNAPTTTGLADLSSNNGDMVSAPTAGAFDDADVNDNLTYSVTGLPDGLMIDANTGEITGTIANNASLNGPYDVTVTASDGTASVDAVFTWNVANRVSAAVDDTDTTDEDTAISQNQANGVLSNDSDPDGDPLTVSQVDGAAGNVGVAVTGGNGGTFTINADGSYTFDPSGDFDDLAAGESRMTSVVYQADDGQGGTDTGRLTVTVNGVNDAPTTSGLNDLSSNDADVVSVPTAGAFADADVNDVLTYSAAGLPAGLTIDAATGEISGTIASDASVNGPYSVTVTASDGTESVDAVFSWAIANPDVVAMDDGDTTDEDTAISRVAAAGVLANDTDPDGDALTVSQVDGATGNVGVAVTGGAGGQFTLNADGSYDFDPNGDFDDLAAGESRVTSVTYQVSDGQGGLDTARLTVTVNGANDAPVAAPDSDTTAEDTAITRNVASGVLANDNDADTNDNLSVAQVNGAGGNVASAVTGSNGGQFTVNSNGSYTFDPGADFDDLAAGESRATAVTYTVSDGNGGTATTTLTVTVDGVNDAPVAGADADSTTENTAISRNVANGVLANDNDAEGDALTVTEVEGNGANVAAAVTGSNGGQFTVNADGSYDFDPGAAFDDLAAGESRATAVGYTVADGNGGTDTATLTVTVNGVNDAPTTSGLNDLSSNDADVVSVPTAGAFADADVNDVLTYSAAGLPAGLTIDAATGEISGTIASDASVNGPYSVTVTASDGTESVDAVFSWAIANPDVVAMDDGDTTDEDTAISRVAAAGVLANDTDPDGDALTVSQVDGATGNVGVAVTGGAGGQFTLNADGSYDFDPNGDFDDLAAGESRVTSVTYQVSDGQGGLDTARLTVTVDGVNDAPVAAPDSDTTAEDTVITRNVASGVLANDNDADTNDNLSVAQVNGAGGNVASAVTGSNGGQFTVNGNGSYTFDPNGAFDDLAAGESRATAVTYTVADGNGGTATTTLTVTVDGVNDVPVAGADADSTTENTAISRNVANGVLANDSDPDANDTLTVSQVNGDPDGVAMPVTGVNGGQFTINADGSYSFDPGADFDDLAAGESRSTAVAYQVSDGNGGIASTTLTVVVNGANDAPVAANDTDTTSENTTITRNAANGVLPNDTDIEANALTVSQINGAAVNIANPVAGTNGGQFTVNADGSYTFNPGGDFDDLAVGESRTTAVTYQVSDGNGGTDTAALTVTVNGANDEPMAIADTDNTAENTVISRNAANGVLTNDADPDANDNLSVAQVNGDAANVAIPVAGSNGGQFTLNGDGSYDFDPGADFDDLATGDSRTTAVSYTVSDGNGGTDTATLTVTVDGANDSPTATADSDSTAENTALNRDAAAGVLGNDQDAENDALAVSQVSGDAGNVAAPVAGGNGGQFTINADGSYNFDPGADFDDLAVGESRTTAVTYQVSDGQGGTDTATLAVTVNGRNDAPVVDDPLAAQTADDGDAVSIPTADAFADVDGDPLTFSAAGLPAGLAIDRDTGLITGTLAGDASQNGPFTVTVTADDGNGGTVASSFSLDATNVPPTAAGDSASSGENTPASGNVLDNDSDGGNDTDALTVAQVNGDAGSVGTAVTGNNGGRFTVNADGGYTFDPGPDFDDLAVGDSRTTSMTYQISDGSGGTDTATLTITVNGANDAPVVDTPLLDQSANDGATVSIPTADAFTDVDGDTLTFSAAGLPDGLTIDAATGEISGTLANNASQNGPYSVTVTATDPSGASVDSRFDLMVNNLGPATDNDIGSTTENAPADGNVLSNDTDPDNDNLSVSQVNGDAGNVGDPVTGANGGRFTINADGSYRFDPAGDFDDLAVGESRTTSVSYQASDGNGGTATGTLTVTVNGTNDVPTANQDTGSTAENATASGDVLANDRDLDASDALTVSQVNGDAGGVGAPVTGSNGGRFTVNADGSYAFGPGADFDDLAVGETRTTTVSYQVDDGNGGIDTTTLTLTITGSNDAPFVDTPLADQAANDGATVSVPTAGAFTDVDGDTLTFSAVDLPDGLVIDPDTGEISGTIDNNASQNAPYNVVVTATDPSGASVDSRFVWTVNNLAPSTADDVDTAAENTAISRGSADGVLANDSDTGTDTDPLTVAAVNGNAGNVGAPVTGDNGGRFTLDAGGSYTFDPNGDFEDLAAGDNRTTSVTYLASDGNGGTETATLTVTVTGANDAPVVDSPLAPRTANDGDPVSVPTAVAFTDVDGDVLTYSAAGLPDGLTIDPATGEISGTIANDASVNGPYDVTVTATDPSGASADSSFTWTVNNVAPVAADDSDTATEDAAISRDDANGVLANDGDAGTDMDDLSVSRVNGAAGDVGVPVTGSNGGRFTVNADGSYTFDPNGDFEDLALGETRITTLAYEVDDANGGTDTGTLTVTVTGSNDAPVVDSPLADQSSNDGKTVSIPAAGAFTDVDGDTLTYSAAGLPDGLTIDPATGEISGTIANNASRIGSYDVTVTATDPSGASVDSRFTWTVNNLAPIAFNDADTTAEDTAISRAADAGVLANDGDTITDTDDLTVSRINGRADNVGAPVAGSNGGRFTVSADGSYTFDPNGDFADLAAGETRTTTLTYQADDGDGGVATATLTVTVNGRNEAPTAGPDTGSTTENDATSGNVLANDTDTDASDTLTVSRVNGSAGSVGATVAGSDGGRFTVNADGSYAFDPGADFDGLALGESQTTTVTYTISDGNGGTDTATLTVTVNGSNDVPVTNDDTAVTGENAAAAGNVLANDSDPDGDSLSVAQVDGVAGDVASPVAGSSGGQFTINADGSYTFDPGADFDDLAAGESRTTSASYQVDDGNGGTDTATLTVTVNGANDAPAGLDIPNDQALLGGGYRNDISGGFTDSDLNDALIFTAEGLPEGLAIDPETGVISGNPAALGVFTVTVTATDGSGERASLAFDLRVTPPITPAADPVLPGAPGNGAQSTLVAGGFLGSAGTLEVDLPAVEFTDPGRLGGDPLGLGLPDEAGNTVFEPLNLRYRGTQTDGSALPGTLTVNADDGELSGQLPEGMSHAHITIIATDDNGNTRTREAIVGPNGAPYDHPDDATDPAAAKTSYHRIEVVVGVDGRVTVGSGDESGYDMRTESIRVDGRDLDIRILDTRASDVARYYGRLTSGEPLPEWLTVDPETGRVSGELPNGLRAISIEVVADGYDGENRTLQIDLKLPASDGGTLAWQSLADQMHSALAFAGDDGGSTYGARMIAALAGQR